MQQSTVFTISLGESCLKIVFKFDYILTPVEDET